MGDGGGDADVMFGPVHPAGLRSLVHQSSVGAGGGAGAFVGGGVEARVTGGGTP